MDDKKRVMAAAEKIGKAKEMHVTSEAGTDVRFSLGQFPAISEYGFVDEPGRWDHWPSGFAVTWASIEGEAEGKIVLERGDILLPMKSYVQDRVHFRIEKGFCTGIEGGFDADILSEYMATYNDPDAYAMSHIGWGLQPRAHWSTMAMYDREATIGMDPRAFEGNFLFSFRAEQRGRRQAGPRPVTSTFPCAIARSRSTVSKWSGVARCSTGHLARRRLHAVRKEVETLSTAGFWPHHSNCARLTAC